MSSAQVQKRPNIPHRHSSSSVSFARSPKDGAPSSAPRQKNIKFAVGQGRVGPRVPSHGKNMNKLGKLTPARPAANASTSPKQSEGQVKRNVSSGHLVGQHPNVALRKNQSETSLKRNNRSSGQLTKLQRPGSSRNMAKGQRRPSRPDRSNSASKKSKGTAAPSVRFDLGTGGDDEDDVELEGEEEEEAAWENYTDSRSPSTTRASTPRPNSAFTSPSKPSRDQPEGNGEPPDKENTVPREDTPTPTKATLAPVRSSSSSINSDSKHAQNHRARAPQADNIASRLLKRNTSFNNAALPRVDSNAATPVLISNPQHASSGSSGNTGLGSSNPEVVSRFLSSHSSSATPHHSVFLPTSSHSPEKDWKREGEDDEDGLRRNRSMPDVAAMRVSRTQQKLNLERESVVREPQSGPKVPPSLLRMSRLSSANTPFWKIQGSAQDGRLHPQLRQLFDHTAKEYNRILQYQNPLTNAISRLEETGAVPRRAITARQKTQHRRGGLLSGSGDGAYGLSQSWRSHRSTKSGDTKDKTSQTPTKDGQANGNVRRPRVMFQGIDTKDDRISDGRQSLDGHPDNEEKDSKQRDEVKELCRRLWHRREAGASEE